ncbi:HNH endonuclease [Deinococcus sp. SDU3-2]|uniref:HNH endonuclease n=1 Tax=Deinococcus terrestris TaxID=2651870 RepID=A0A7X1NYM4_9DEIO|nr:HNH endonuclease [Deinococcus terrestris]MPY68221.1 HNH endonuclease [Deinococcus terrestris]
MGKVYTRVWVPEHRRSVRLPRQVAAELLGRPLLPGEVVHHIDGDSLNNAPENLLVLPSQRHHASLEQYLRRARRGQPTLFPYLLEAARDWSKGTLFQHVG